MPTTWDKALGTIWRSLLVGAGYTLALSISGMIASMVGMSLPEAKDPLANLMWSFVGGAIMGLFLGSIASSVPLSRLRHVFVWSSVILFNLVSVIIEGYFFAPLLTGDSLPGLILQQFLVAFITGWIIASLFTSRESVASITPPARSFLSWSWRFVMAALSYLVFYFIFGAINFTLVTGSYYKTHAGGLEVPVLSTILTAELIRSVLIILSILPFLLSMQMRKKRLALLSGLILFSVGGLVPLTMQAGALPFVLLAASAVEIFFQNFSVGAVTAFLLGQSE